MVDKDEEVNNNPVHIEDLTEEDSDVLYFHIFLEVVLGCHSPKALKFTRSIKGLSITILVDINNSHNII